MYFRKISSNYNQALYFEDQDPKSTTIYDNLPLNFKDRALELIAGFEIEIHEIDTVFKLSQDRDYESYQNIINHLKVKDESARVIAQEMEKRKKTRRQKRKKEKEKREKDKKEGKKVISLICCHNSKTDVIYGVEFDFQHQKFS